MDLQALKAELTADPLGRGYSTMTDQEAVDSLNAANRTLVRSRFGSFRTVANILTDEEYATCKATLTAAAAQNVRVADAVEMLKLPGDNTGNGGGIDFGAATVRGMVDALFSAELAAKLKAIAEDAVSRAEELGLGVVSCQSVKEARAI